ncbi:MAG: response regulator [Salibacteraceae bacterium]
MKVFVIDDDDIYQFLLKKELKHTNMVERVTMFSDGRKALDYFLNHKEDTDNLPDIVFLDINMPIMNGWRFLEEFKMLSPKIKKSITLYLVSSSFDDRDISRSKEYSEVTDYIIKPVKRSDLISVLEDI